MRFTSALSSLLILLSSTTSDAFVVPARLQSQYAVSSNLHFVTALGSTLAPETPKVQSEGGHSENRGAISMNLEELGNVLGGYGRAQIVWDCYAIGIDPANFFGQVIKLGYDDFESILGMLPSCRRSQSLGKDALAKLASLYSDFPGNKVEGGVASLSYMSRSSDGTTKLLLTLRDGLQVETVIIPWKGQRSTLCISSQVGCRQGKVWQSNHV